MAIKNTVCGVKGHDIRSVATKDTIIPNTTIRVTTYEILCGQCGASLEDIRKERMPSDKPRVRKKPTIDPPANPVEAQ